MKRTMVVALEDFRAGRLTCHECQRGGVLLPFDEEETVAPYCQHALLKSENDPTLKLLAGCGKTR